VLAGRIMATSYIVGRDGLILVTGSNGFIGKRVVRTLLELGFTQLRCFVRPSSRIDELKDILRQADAVDRVELITGDLLAREDCCGAAEGVSVIYHLAAGLEKSFAGAFMNSALTTRNLMDAFLEHGQPKRFVNVSSFAVYSNRKLKRGALLDENCPLEDGWQAKCDAYGFGKVKQEELVREYGRERNLPFVILRPGAVFGPGKTELSGRVGVNTFGFLLHLGGSNQLPLTFVDNCAEAIVLAGLMPGIDGEVFNIVDDELLTSRDFLRAYRKKTGQFAIGLPYCFSYALCSLWESYSARSNNQLLPVFNRRRCSAEWKGNRYTNQKAKTQLGWRPKVDIKTAMSAFLAQFD
jgi:nucleoside-diphosphate-sugar epimerase